MVCMFILVMFGVAVFLSPHPPRWSASGMRGVSEVLRMAWTTQGAIVSILGGLVVGALSIRGSD